jgi:hypothetical protein
MAPKIKKTTGKRKCKKVVVEQTPRPSLECWDIDHFGNWEKSDWDEKPFRKIPCVPYTLEELEELVKKDMGLFVGKLPLEVVRVKNRFSDLPAYEEWHRRILAPYPGEMYLTKYRAQY